MYSIEKITSILKPVLEQSDLFLVDLSIGTNNHIKVLIDSVKGISVDKCVEVSKYLESQLNRDKDDFELEVSSPGVGAPLKVFQQYIQNIGRTVLVFTSDNLEYKGELLSAEKDSIVVRTGTTIKQGKKKVKQYEEKIIPFDTIRSTKVIIKF